ncbi:MAG: tRNA adenosine(34) deaminase TadA [Burkholderiaceae bacterium]|nr:MAG: tRNA adenosine(34) deaminase TadA [Burkholderiaceae bacterium]
MLDQDTIFMRQALDQGHNAWTLGEVPVGAVLIRDGKVVATGFNQPIGTHDPTAHAEIMALRAAAESLGNYRLTGCELYVTLEPCAMCVGAMLHARLKRVVFGAFDPKTGAAGSVVNLFSEAQLNHQTEVQGGVLAEACGQMLKDFFTERRKNAKNNRTEEDSDLMEDEL